MNEVTIRFLPPAHVAEMRCATISRYLGGALRDQAHCEQVWVVSVDDEGTPRSRRCCYAGSDSNGSVYLRDVLLTMLQSTDGRFVVVHYGLGEDAGREFCARLVCTALRRIESMAGFTVVDYLVANNVNEMVRFISLGD